MLSSTLLSNFQTKDNKSLPLMTFHSKKHIGSLTEKYIIIYSFTVHNGSDRSATIAVIFIHLCQE